MALRPLNPRSQRNIRFPRRRSRLVPILWFGAFCLTVWLFYGIVSFFVGKDDPEAYFADNEPAQAVAQADTQPFRETPQSNAEVVAQAAWQYRAQHSTLPAQAVPQNLSQEIPSSALGQQAPQGITPSQHSAATKNQSAETPVTRRLHNGVSWNIPYVGFKLEEIATSIQQKYPTLRAGTLAFQPAGVYTTLPNHSRLPGKRIALTINGCGPFGAGEALFSLLQKERIPTTFFLSSTWIVKHKKDFTAIEKNPLFSIQAHGKKHVPLSMKGESLRGVKGTKSLSGIIHEIEGNVRDIQRLTNKRPQWFRSAFNMYDKEVANVVSRELNLPLAGYALDANAPTPEAMAEKLLMAKHGDIIMLEFTNGKQLSDALALAIPRLKSQGFTFVPLTPPAGT